MNPPRTAGAGLTLQEAVAQVQTLMQTERHAEVIDLCRRILQSVPDRPEVHGFLALSLWQQGQRDTARTHAETGARLNAESGLARYALGFILYHSHQPREAFPHLLKAIERQPDLTVAHNHVALCHSCFGDYDQALAHLETALHLQPTYAPGHFNRAVLLLTLGQYDRGWLEFEWRWHTGDLSRPAIPRPRWDGSNLAGKSILIHTEQGMGDTIQFVRLLPLLKQRGGRVVFACQKPLQPLLSRCDGVDDWLPIDQEAKINFDLYVPLGSLPNRLGINDETVPRKVPYVFPDPQRVERWRKVVGALDGFKVGIAWQGSRTYVDDHMRSMPLRHFAALAEVPGVRLISLQKGYGEEQVAANRDRVPVTVLDGLDETGGALEDTAAVMQHLDLVVACNSSITHLAGALGKPVWLALSTAAEWHWLRGRTDSPWYPTLRIFRQASFGDWDSAFAAMRDALRQRLAPPPAAPAAAPVSVAIAPGELFDKLTILEIKAARITDAAKLAHVRHELDLLLAARDAAVATTRELDQFVDELRRVNEEIWEIEEGVRACERDQDFGPRFVELARSVYRTNDHRAAVKRRINDLLGSGIVEEKSYPDYSS